MPAQYSELISKGNFYAEALEYDNAIEFYTKAIEYSPEMLAAYILRADVYFKLKRFRDALDDYNKAVSMISTPLEAARVYVKLGDVYREFVKLEDYSSMISQNAQYAQTCYSKATKIDSKCILGFIGIGDILFILRYPKGAIANYMEALRINAQHELADSVKEKMDAVYRRYGMYEEAVSLCSQVIRHS